MRFVVARCAQADKIIINKRKFRKLVRVFDVMHDYRFAVFAVPFAPLALIMVPLEDHPTLVFPALGFVVEGQSFSSIDNRIPAAIVFCSNGTVLYFNGLAIDVTSSLVTSLDKPVPDELYHLIRQMPPPVGSVHL